MRRQSGVTRRELLCNSVLGTAALAAGGIGAYAQSPPRPPNIIFILADDLGYADVSCYGRRDFTTPNIDRIAARGMRFLQGYANSAVCSASRLALITGRYQYRLRLGLEEPLVGHPEVGLPPEHPTLPSLLKKAGYGTTLIGKWHLGVCRNSVRSRAVMITSSVSAVKPWTISHRSTGVSSMICGTRTSRSIRSAISPTNSAPAPSTR
jgi:hypothetical protein